VIRHLFARLLPSRGRHREPATTEPPSTVNPDAGPAPATVHLPTVLDEDPGHGAAGHLPPADGQPTPNAVSHVGATESFGDLLAAMRDDLAHDTGSLDPDERAWAEAFRRAADVIDAEAERGRRVLHEALERFCPGWSSQPPKPAGDFIEAMELAGVIVLPAVPVDWSTSEWAMVPV
jgi:hypothetical protein